MEEIEKNKIHKDINKLVKSYVDKYLDQSKYDLFSNVIDALSKLDDIDMTKGKLESWACGISHAVCSMNALDVKLTDIYTFFNVSSSTGLKKSKLIKEVLEKNNYRDEKKPEVKYINYLEDIDYINAQNKIKEAYNQKNFKKKLNLAKEALSICKECSDAYIILANDQNLNNEEKEKLLKRSVKASLNILGISDIFDLGDLENFSKEIMPYLATQYRLANHLWDTKKREEAINICMHLLECDPKDRLMIRSILLSWTLLANDTDKTEYILNKYKNDYLTSAIYSKALYLIKKDEIDKAKKELKRAIRYNRFVIPYILKMKRIQKVLPVVTRFGSEEEAVHYMLYGYDAWNSTDNAINIAKTVYNEVKKDWA